jgi:hypothetical protein
MKKIAFLLVFWAITPSVAQTDAGNLEVYLNTILDNIPGDSGDDYSEPSASDLVIWEECINALLNADLTTARTKADLVDYKIVTYTDTGSVGKTVHILERTAGSTNHWGTYVFDDSLETDVVIQAPHAIFDFNTGKQAIYCFRNLQVAFLFLNGTHRCNHSQTSTCSGTTAVCGGASMPFRISDLAHTVNSAWQKATEIVYDRLDESIFVQLHGFTKLPSDPYVILSNGTNITPSGADNVATFRDFLFNEDNTLTFKIAHLDNWTRLVGFTNTQGRYINQSSDPCTSSATMTADRFVHVEQEKTKLRDDQTGWHKMYLTLGNMYGGTASVEDLIQFQLKSENPFQNSIEFFANGVKKIGVYSLTGKELYAIQNKSAQTEFSIPTTTLSSGLYILKVHTNQGTAAKKLIRQ